MPGLTVVGYLGGRADERALNRQRGEQAERAWKDKPLGYEKEAEALASSYPLVKQALEAIFAGIRAVTTMPHLEQGEDPLLDLADRLTPLSSRTPREPQTDVL